MSHISVIKLPDNSTYDIKDNNAISTSQKGAANGVVPLNGSSQIDSIYLPSYVDDVIEGYYYNEKFWEDSEHTTEIEGEAGKIYINLGTSPATTYRYSGSTFVQIGSGGSIITITRDLTSGVKSATINVNGTDFDIYSTEDTTYESKSPVSGGTALSLVTTGEKAAWNAKTSNTGTVTSITAGTGLTGGEITTSGTIALATSGATAGSYGDSAAQTPAYGETFKVPYVTVDTYGRVTGISEHTVKIPESDNTTYSAGTGLDLSGTTFSVKLGYTTSGNNRAVQADSNGNLYIVQKDDSTNNTVTQTATTTSANYEVLFSATADNTTRTEGARKNSNLLFNPNTGNLQATQLNGVTIGSSPEFTDTTYQSKAAASGGTDVSLVTTGEKYIWNISCPIGKIDMYAGSTAPTGWLFCDGQAVSRTTYASLFEVIGTTYGEGDGSTTFNLPDMSDRVAIGSSGTRELGEQGGSESTTYTPAGAVANTTLSAAQSGLREHNHTITQYTTDSGSTTKYCLHVAHESAKNLSQQIQKASASAATSAHKHTFTGTEATLDIVQPYITVNYIIYAGLPVV